VLYSFDWKAPLLFVVTFSFFGCTLGVSLCWAELLRKASAKNPVSRRDPGHLNVFTRNKALGRCCSWVVERFGVSTKSAVIGLAALAALLMVRIEFTEQKLEAVTFYQSKIYIFF